MRITWQELSVDLTMQSGDELLSEWRWMVPDSMTLHMVSSVGDAFLRDVEGGVFWLDTGTAELHRIAESEEQFDFLRQQRDYADQWFVPQLVGDLMAQGHSLALGQCFSYKVPPTLGGEFQPTNFEPCDLAVHFSLLGQLQRQAKGLPAGTSVSSVTADEA